MTAQRLRRLLLSALLAAGLGFGTTGCESSGGEDEIQSGDPDDQGTGNDPVGDVEPDEVNADPFEEPGGLDGELDVGADEGDEDE